MTEAAVNFFYKTIGVGFLALGKAKSLLIGYKRSRPFPASQIGRTVDYDLKVVDEWLEVLVDYTGQGVTQLAGKRVLELGPGPDFGVALYLLSKGVEEYGALDAFPLALRAPPELHEAILARIEQLGSARPLAELRAALPSAQANGRIRYQVRDDFDITAAFPSHTFDYVFSQAAFEHFDDIDTTIRQLSQVSQPGTRLIAGIDLQTHTRWIRDKDPLNIYRYSKRFYDLFAFKGMPNRVATSDYERALRKYGWENIEMRALGQVADADFERVNGSLHASFRKQESKNLWVIACATRGS